MARGSRRRASFSPGRCSTQDVTVGMSFAGALTPAGMGCSSIVPLIKAGFVDWIVATGANLYHDMHFALNYPVRVGSFKFDDTDLREQRHRPHL